MSWIKIILVNVVVTFTLAEVTLRYIYTPYSVKNRIILNKLAESQGEEERAIFNFVDMRYQPRSKSIMKHAEYEFATTHDEYGFRNPCFTLTDQKDNYDLIIGDSFIYGTGLPNSNTYSCLLNSELSKYYTLGVPGLDVPKYIQMLTKNISNLRNSIGEPKKIFLVLFLGNDFETLKNYHLSTNPETSSESKSEDNSYTTSLMKINRLLMKINRFITKTKLINQSYAVASIKIIIKDLVYSSNKGDFIVNYAGSSFYKKSTEHPISDVTSSLLKIKSKLKDIKLNLDGLFLIEDPAMLSTQRLERDLSIAGGFDVNIIDTDFKTSTVIEACKKIGINCYNTRHVLNADDYYIADNHLNPNGAVKFSKFILSKVAN